MSAARSLAIVLGTLLALCGTVSPGVTGPALSRIEVNGRTFVAGGRVFRPVFASELALLSRAPDRRAVVLDQVRALGFNGIRVFAGDLAWAGQTPASARAAFPTVLGEAATRGLYVYVSAITGAATGYDIEQHLGVVAAACAAVTNCLLEIANEPDHHTQNALVNDPTRLLALARRAVPAGVSYALGAASEDQADGSGRYRFDGGAFNTVHLDRGGDPWKQAGRLREIARISEVTGKPAMSGEPIGAADAAQPGRRESRPEFFFAMGALCRVLEIGCVFHSEDGLNARLLSAHQRACAEAFIAGWRAIPTEDRLELRDAGGDGSPVKRADSTHVGSVVAGLSGLRAYVALIGVHGDPGLVLGDGWRIRGILAERPGVQVVALER